MNAINEEYMSVAIAMQERGGSFVKALGNALMRADAQNREKIRRTFSEYWKEYGGSTSDVIMLKIEKIDLTQTDLEKAYRDGYENGLNNYSNLSDGEIKEIIQREC